MLLTKSIKVRSLTIKGTLLVEPVNAMTIDAAFVIVFKSGSKLTVRKTSWSNNVTIYLRLNPDAYPDIPDGATEKSFLSGGRVLAGK